MAVKKAGKAGVVGQVQDSALPFFSPSLHPTGKIVSHWKVTSYADFAREQWNDHIVKETQTQQKNYLFLG